MVDATHISFMANDRSYFSLIKKEINRIAKEAGIIPVRLYELDLIVAEITSNLYKYSDDGEILLGVFDAGGVPYIELISIDNGPGMTNPLRMIQDGISTSKTLGHGLGSIKRLSDDFDLYSQVGWGTILLSRLYNDPVKAKTGRAEPTISPIIVAKPGESKSGDGFILKKNSNYLKVMLADGLGHGPEANKALNEAAEAFMAFPDYSPTETLRFIHNSIKKTRGAVINIICYEYSTKTWISTGVGNIAVRFLGPTSLRNHLCYNGIVGHNMPTSMNDLHFPANEFNQVMLCSDGIKTRIDLAKYPQMSKYDQTIFAAAIYKDHARKTDDMSVVMVKI